MVGREIWAAREGRLTALLFRQRVLSALSSLPFERSTINMDQPPDGSVRPPMVRFEESVGRLDVDEYRTIAVKAGIPLEDIETFIAEFGDYEKEQILTNPELTEQIWERLEHQAGTPNEQDIQEFVRVEKAALAEDSSNDDPRDAHWRRYVAEVVRVLDLTTSTPDMETGFQFNSEFHDRVRLGILLERMWWVFFHERHAASGKESARGLDKGRSNSNTDRIEKARIDHHDWQKRADKIWLSIPSRSKKRVAELISDDLKRAHQKERAKREKEILRSNPDIKEKRLAKIDPEKLRRILEDLLGEGEKKEFAKPETIRKVIRKSSLR